MIEYWIDDVPVDGPATDAALEKAQADAKQGKELRKATESDTIGAESKEPPANAQAAAPGISTKAGGDVNFICKLDRNIYSCVSKDITTDEVVISDERIAHIKERHPEDYERYCTYIAEMIQNPDYILENKPNTALILKEFQNEESEYLRLVLRLKTSVDNSGYKNSVITFMKTNRKKWEQNIRNKKILYRR